MSERSKAILSLALSVITCVMIVANWYQVSQRQSEQEARIAQLRHVMSELTLRLVEREQRDRQLNQMNAALQSIVDEITEKDQ
jgi:cell division protein ZapA (FtsZ GTPase activity inhibitor)